MRTTPWRQLVVTVALVAGGLWWPAGLAAATDHPTLDVDYGRIVARADLTYDKPVRREEGMPLGNGRMGSLVRTVPTALRLQINCVDVFGSDCTSNSFPERNTDYCGGCAFVDIELAGCDGDVFAEGQTSQHLACHDGLVTVKGREVEIRARAWHEQDVMAFEVTDRRRRPDAVRVNLRMLRPALVRTMSHVARSKLEQRDGVLSKLGVTAAMMGRADHVRYLLPNQINSPEAPVRANRMDLRKGFQTTSIQRLGRAADTLHHALCQSIPAAPGREPVIRVFPAWPRQWDATFTLLARGAFLVSSSLQAGRIEFVRIQSQAGGECRLRNPWPGTTVTLERSGSETQELSGALLRFSTTTGERVTMRPAR